MCISLGSVQLSAVVAIPSRSGLRHFLPTASGIPVRGPRRRDGKELPRTVLLSGVATTFSESPLNSNSEPPRESRRETMMHGNKVASRVSAHETRRWVCVAFSIHPSGFIHPIEQSFSRGGQTGPGPVGYQRHRSRWPEVPDPETDAEVCQRTMVSAESPRRRHSSAPLHIVSPGLIAQLSGTGTKRSETQGIRDAAVLHHANQPAVALHRRERRAFRRWHSVRR